MSEVLPALSRDQQAAMARQLAETFGMSPWQPLELAGRNLALVAKELLDGDLADRPVVVLAGRGVTGAAGLVAARHLLNWGAWLQVLCLPAGETPDDDQSTLADDARQTLQAMGAPLAWAEEGWELPPCDLVIDALVGGELRATPQGKVRDLIQLANSSVAPLLSLTAPSGVDADAGTCFAPHVQAAATLVLGLPWRGLLADAARAACGDLYIGDVGVPLALYEAMGLEMPPCFGRDPVLRWEVVAGTATIVGEG